MNLLIIFLGLVGGIILIPVLLLFLFCTLTMIVLMMGFESITGDKESEYELINHGLSLLNEDWQPAIWNIINYFGSDLYWIIGGILIHHLIFDVIMFYRKLLNNKSKQENEDTAWDMYVHFTFKAMGQSSAIMLCSIIIALPVSIIVIFFTSQLWIAYLIIIILRIILEMTDSEIVKL
ncbi:MAG: hypothetical protein MK207_10050 [Saprospiraceae bacterium]|nr:hypothetical protein [Saprospiraceae bacterium]